MIDNKTIKQLDKLDKDIVKLNKEISELSNAVRKLSPIISFLNKTVVKFAETTNEYYTSKSISEKIINKNQEDCENAEA